MGALLRGPALAAATAIVPVAPAIASEPLSASAVEPVVLMQEKQLKGCGFAALYDLPAGRLRVAIENLHAGPATRLELVLDWTRPAGTPPEIKAASITTPRRPEDPFTTDLSGAPAALRRAASVDQTEGALFMQSVMVLGGTVEIELVPGERASLALPVPLPQSVRASYLNCTGDLYRPESGG